MIPLQLKIRNFLSYGPQGEIIDLEPHHLICLTGKNGHGKSAMLDAITWALWGQARKIAGVTRNDEHLVRLGESGMTVTLDFSCDNQRYRVTRDFSLAQNKKGITQLHLGLFKDDIQAYVSLSEKNIRDTQEKLDTIVGLDYDTFINSVFLRQGQANEFSKKSPLERKEILSALLGLSRYEELRKQVLENQRVYEKEQGILTHITKSFTDELSAKQEVILQAEAIEKTLTENTETQKSYTKKLEILSIEQQQVTQDRTALALANQSLEQLAQAYTKQKIALVNLLSERRDFQHKKRLLNIDALIQAHETATQKLADYEQLKTALMALKEKLFTISTERQNRYVLLQTELQAKGQLALSALNQEQLGAERAQNNLADKQQKLVSIQTQKQELLAKKIVLKDACTRTVIVVNTAQLLEKQIARKIRFIDRCHQYKQNAIERASAALIRSEQLTTHNSICPLCTQTLPEPHRVVLIANAKKTAQRHTNRYNRVEKILKKLDTQIKDHESEYKKMVLEKEELLAKAQQHTQIGELICAHEHELCALNQLIKEAHEQIMFSAKKLSAAQAVYDHAQNALTTIAQQDPLLSEYAQEIVTLENQIKLFEKNSSTINEMALREEIARINDQQKAFTLLGHEQTQNKKRSYEIRAIIQELRKNTQEQELLKKTIQDLEPRVMALTANERLIQEIRKKLEIIQEKNQVLFEQKGALTRQLVVFEKRAQELAINQEKIKQLDQLIDDHQLLAQALSKNGIQALIIEQAVPELESEANLLLARLTDNQSHIMFESLRDLKSGGSKETLDIKISDAMGTRPYELFSGGEAFRIDFALRIALSKLLARRSGTTLQTLIIDEGFGSQDEEGLALIQEAILAIQNDFEKIIIVSHLPAMKHQFPTNFVIRKGVNGSAVTVVEQG